MKKHQGFTLIELLAVILILGIIVLIAIPTVSKIIKQAKDNAFITEALTYLNTAENEVGLKEYKVPTKETDSPLIFLFSDLNVSNGSKSPYGKKYLSGSNITITSDNSGKLTYSLTAFDEGDNAIIGQTLDSLQELGTKAIVRTNPEEEDIKLPHHFVIGESVTLKDGGGKFTVIKEANASALTVTLFADYVVKKDLSGLDSSCIGTAPYCSVIQFDADPYNAEVDISSITPDNIGYYLTNYQNSLRVKYSDNSIIVEVPTLDTLINITNSLSIDSIREDLNKEGNTRDLNLEILNLDNINLMFKGQNYWFNTKWLDLDSGKNWYWYARDSYGKVIDAYWSNHDSMAGFRPIVTIPVKYIN